MAKKTKTKPFRVKRRIDPEVLRKLKRGLAHATAVTLVVLGVGAGLYYAKRHVDRRIAFYGRAPRVVLKDRPVWMSDYLADQITSCAQPLGAHSSFDHELLVDVADTLRGNPWIKRVRAVRRVYGKRPGDTIEIDCEYRVPLALVHWKDYYWLVDGEGVKLPEQFTPQQLPHVINGRDGKRQFRVVEGVQEPPVESGQRWPGEDLAAALELARYLYRQPFAEEVARIDVSNFGGRVSHKEAQLVLVTTRDSEIRWGRPVSAKDFFVEVSVAQKLDYLQRVWRQFGRIDANQPWIDIRFDKITYPSGGMPGSPEQARLDGSR